MKKVIFVIFGLICGSITFAKDLTVAIGAGENYKQRKNPQIAVWVEDTDGGYLKTLFVTKKADKKSWIFAPKNGRPESLPVWYNASRRNEKRENAATEEFDLVSSATPKGGVNLEFQLEDGKDYVIKVEINNSFDYNETFTKKNSGVNGQPGVVYAGTVPKDFEGEICMELVGSGSVDGSDGELHGIEGLTTAKNIVKAVSVVVKQNRYERK